MKLDYDCIRTVLLALEDFEFISEELTSNYFSMDEIKELSHSSNFKISDIVYTLIILDEAGLIKINSIGKNVSGQIRYIFIERMTKEGHDFLENIKADNNWNKVKSIGEKIGAISINVISQIATNVISQLILAQI
jgi:hypothetical protein